MRSLWQARLKSGHLRIVGRDDQNIGHAQRATLIRPIRPVHTARGEPGDQLNDPLYLFWR